MNAIIIAFNHCNDYFRLKIKLQRMSVATVSYNKAQLLRKKSTHCIATANPTSATLEMSPEAAIFILGF